MVFPAISTHSVQADIASEQFGLTVPPPEATVQSDSNKVSKYVAKKR